MTRWFSDLVERWLGIEQAASGEGTVWRLQHAWGWAPWLTVAFALGVVLYVAWIYSREGGDACRGVRTLLALARIVALALVCFMIASVVISLERTGLPFLVIAVDQSGSMGTTDRTASEEEATRRDAVIAEAGFDAPTRLNLAKAFLLQRDAALLQALAAEHKLRLYQLGDAALPQTGDVAQLAKLLEPVEPRDQHSRLGEGVRSILNDLRGTPPTAVILLTDGVTTDGESLSQVAAYARRKRVPLFTIGVGNDVPLQDIEISDLLVDEVVFVDEIVNVDFKLLASGYEGRTVEVVWRRQDQASPLAQTTVRLGADGQPQRVRLPFRPTEVGDFEYVIEVAPQEGEVQSENNRRSCLVSVRKEQIRVLYVQAYPNFEFRYLKNMLERNPTIELKTFLQESDPEYIESDKSAISVFPARREALFEYDVVIFGDVNPDFLGATAIDHLAQFVQEKGGGLIVMAGPRYTPDAYRHTPLAPLIPIDLTAATGSAEPAQSLADGAVVVPTELGLASPPLQLGDSPEETLDIWRKLPPLFWFHSAARLRPGALAWAEHPHRVTDDSRPLPVIAVQYAGAGKVLYHGTDETWRWRWRAGDVFFARYWVQSIRYLSRLKLLGKDRQAQLTADRREYRRGETVRFRVRFTDERLAPVADDGVTLVLEHPAQPKTQLKLQRNSSYRGIFEGEFSQAAEGSYHAWIAVPTLEGRAPATDFLVVAPPGELARTQLDVAELVRASEETGGKFYRLADAGSLLNDLPRGRSIPIESLPPLVLWNKWPLLASVIALLAAEWTLRKRRGML